MAIKTKKLDFLITQQIIEAKKELLCNIYTFLKPVNVAEFSDSFKFQKANKFKLIYGKDEEKITSKPYTRIEIKLRCLRQIEKFQKIKENLKKYCLDKNIYFLYKNFLNELILKRKLYLHVGDNDKFTEISRKIYPLPSKEIFQQALSILEKFCLSKNKPKLIRISSRKFVDEFKKLFKKNKIEDCEIVLEKAINSRGMVVRKIFGNQIKVHVRDNKKGIVFAAGELQITLQHELVHILRNKNGKKQPLSILQAGTAGYAKTEEGLASYLSIQKIKQKGISLTLARNALRTVVLFWALKIDNQEIYKKIRHFGFSHQLAIETILRVKRGTDGASGAVFSKDGSTYYPGLLEIEKFIKEKISKGWTEKKAVNLLLQGKFAISDLKILEKIIEFKKHNYKYYSKEVM